MIANNFDSNLENLVVLYHQFDIIGAHYIDLLFAWTEQQLALIFNTNQIKPILSNENQDLIEKEANYYVKS